MSSNNVILCLQKQNDSIFASLISKNIQFDRVEICDGINEQEHLILLTEENVRLKEIVKANKPISQPKESKSKESKSKESKSKESKSKEVVESKTKELKLKEIKENDNDNEDDENDTFEEPVKKFDTITNMEDMKRAFFRGDYVVFQEQLKLYPLKLYKVGYKYNSDKDGVPEFSAKNLLKGFVRNFDDYRKYFMICFRCFKAQDKNEYKYDSLWIINSGEHIQNIIGSMWEDFEFEETSNIDDFVTQIQKLPEADEPVYVNDFTCIGESYVH